jgi:SAM-dependent methyltransferase
VATGSGEVAIRAARAGASVTGIDFSEGMLARARRKAEGLGVQWDLGDAQALPYADRAFDVVSSNFGVIFPPDAGAAGRELARVCRPGGRLGLTTWRPRPALSAIYARFRRDYSPGPFDDWGREDFIEHLLGRDFELTVEERTWYLEGASPEAVFETMAVSAPPTKAYLESVDASTRAQVREALIEYWTGFSADGAVREPRPYLLVLGRRR